jgi:hypothetical protein
MQKKEKGGDDKHFGGRVSRPPNKKEKAPVLSASLVVHK